MQFFSKWTLAPLAMLALGALAAPTAGGTKKALVNIDRFVYLNETEATQAQLVARGGDHGADFYAVNGCDSNTYIGSAKANFGCGGTCYLLGSGTNGATSVRLWQQNTGGNHPTGSMYTSSDCTGSHQSVGIFSGHLDGCSNDSGSQVWKSAFVYYGC